MLNENNDSERMLHTISRFRAANRLQSKSVTLFGILLLFVLTTLCGCTFTGLVAGSIIDSNKKDEWMHKEGWQSGKLKPGDSVRVQLRQGDTLTANYLGLGRVSIDEYARLYAKICSTQVEGVTFPCLYDSMWVNSQGYANDTKGEFAGFDYQRIALRRKDSTENLRMMPSAGSVITFKNSDTLDSRTIRNLTATGAIPLLSTVRVGKTEEIRIDQVSELQVYGKTTITKKLVIIGAVVDTAVLTLLIAAAVSLAANPI